MYLVKNSSWLLWKKFVNLTEKNVTLMEVIVELKKAVSIGDWNRVMELIEELEIIEREDEFEVDQWSETWDY